MSDVASPSAPSAPAVGASALLTNSTAPAAPPPPSFMPAGFPVAPPAFDEPAAVAARAEINSLKSDKEFYSALKAERERGVTGPASQRWSGLHARGWPTAPAITSQADVDTQASSRNAEMWDAHIAALRTRFALTEQQEAEIRSGVVDEKSHAWAREEKDRLIKDRGFYRRLLDGDRKQISNGDC